MNSESNHLIKPHEGSGGSTQLFLTGAMLFANLDFGSLGDYALKAAVGGAIWMSFKLTADYITNRMRKK